MSQLEANLSQHGANIRAGDGSGPWSSQVGWSGQAGGRVRQVVGSGQAGGQDHFGTFELPGRQAPYGFLIIDIYILSRVGDRPTATILHA